MDNHLSYLLLNHTLPDAIVYSSMLTDPDVQVVQVRELSSSSDLKIIKQLYLMHARELIFVFLHHTFSKYNLECLFPPLPKLENAER